MLILASSSPRRRELVSTLGLPFTIYKPDINETQRPGENPLDYVMRLSREKAAAAMVGTPFWTSDTDKANTQKPVPTDHPIGTPLWASASGNDEVGVLAADTVVILSADTMGLNAQGEILGKPVDAEDARRMLRDLRGRTHQVCTAITVMRVGTVTALSRLNRTDVTMRAYTDAEIEAYIATGDPFDKAGSYAIQHPVFRPVARIDGCYTNVVGLPMCTLKYMLKQFEVEDGNINPECRCREEYQALFL